MYKKFNYDRQLFPDSLLQNIEKLPILLKKKSTSMYYGKSVITSLYRYSRLGEFQSYRPYVPGDDWRYLDWALYARSDELYTKVFLVEGSFRFNFWIDASASMRIGDPCKFMFSLQMAAAISYCLLNYGSLIRIILLEGSKITESPVFRGFQNFLGVLEFLSWRQALGQIDWDAALAKDCVCREDYVILMSDLWAAVGAKKILTQIAQTCNEFAIYHILSSQEIEPKKTNTSVLLQDIETNQTHILFLDLATLQEYQKLFKEFQKDWQTFCHQNNIHYHFLVTSEPSWQFFKATKS